MIATIRVTTGDAERWDAVGRRDAGADGSFVTAVRTTRIYCRPQCSARRPLRQNVEFFDTPAAAQAAGYRPCKRCQPDGPTPDSIVLDIVDRACRTIAAAQTPPTLAQLAADAGQSPGHFQRTFKRIVGVSPREFAAAKRAEHLRRELPAHARVTDAMYEAGFASSSRAYSVAASTLGMTPAASRDGGRGERVCFTALQTAFGWIAVAVTSRGVAAIELGDDREALCERIKCRFAAADVVEDASELQAEIAAVLRYIERPAAGIDLPLDVQGTAFSRRVWRALLDVAPGETATYAQIAKAVGQPGAARAVANACAANPVALAIPCHRVVPAGGGSGGYRWGSARKRALLEAESQK